MIYILFPDRTLYRAKFSKKFNFLYPIPVLIQPKLLTTDLFLNGTSFSKFNENYFLSINQSIIHPTMNQITDKSKIKLESALISLTNYLMGLSRSRITFAYRYTNRCAGYHIIKPCLVRSGIKVWNLKPACASPTRVSHCLPLSPLVCEHYRQNIDSWHKAARPNRTTI